MKITKISTSKTVYVLCLLLILSSCNKLGPNSDKLVGQWLKFNNGSEWESKDQYAIVKTAVTLDLEKSGGGSLLNKVIIHSVNKNENFSYMIKYTINWMTKNNGSEDFLIVNFKKGKIINLAAADSLKTQQDITKEINEHIGKSDTTFFAVETDGSLICHLPNETKKFKMNFL